MALHQLFFSQSILLFLHIHIIYEKKPMIHYWTLSTFINRVLFVCSCMLRKTRSLAFVCLFTLSLWFDVYRYIRSNFFGTSEARFLSNPRSCRKFAWRPDSDVIAANLKVCLLWKFANQISRGHSLLKKNSFFPFFCINNAFAWSNLENDGSFTTFSGLLLKISSQFLFICSVR